LWSRNYRAEQGSGSNLIEQITTTGDQLKFGLNNASLDGSVNLRLESDELWSGLPA
jgi:hypothetical protein